MKFGIIVCPKCKNAKVVNLSCKTSRCYGCNEILTFEKFKIQYKTDSEQKARLALGLINAEIDGKLDEYKEIMKESEQTLR